jgi:protein-disulfide isomerase
MKNLNVVIATLVGAVLGFAADRAISQNSAAQPSAAAVRAFADAARDAVRGAQAQPGADQVFKVLLGNAPQKGRPDAKVTIVEWSDFQCPFCGRANNTMKEVERLYGDDIRVVFKQNPLPMHPDAPFAAKAAMAAGRQGKFWQMHDKLFEANVRGAQTELAGPKVMEMAKSLGLDMNQFTTDANSTAFEDEVRSDQAQARQLGANGTPHFFINGVRLSGAQPLENFKAVIDRQMKKADELLAKGVSRNKLYDELIKDGATQPPAPPNRPTPPAPPAQVRKVEPGNGPAKGAKQPKVTMVMWSDFQCPFCSRAEPTVAKILETYKDDVRIVWRNEPLSFHPNAMPAAKAAMAAHKQGKFWEMHAKLFANQQQLSEDSYATWAKEIGLDMAKWKADKESPEIAELINKDSAYGQQVGADGTPTFFINGKVIAGAMPFESFKPIIDEQIKKADELIAKGTPRAKLYDVIVAENVKAAPAAPAAQAAGDAGEKVKIDVGSSPVLGAKNAPVTIAIWSDFQCPYCSRVEPTLKQIRDEYGNKVKFVWKNQPLSFHQNAMPAAEAAMAAGEQGKFWEMHDKLFANQQGLGPALYEQTAKELGLDMNRWKTAVESHKFQAQIQADMAAGNAVGAGGTPTMFINGRKLVGAQPFAAFKQVIDAELAAPVAKK